MKNVQFTAPDNELDSSGFLELAQRVWPGEYDAESTAATLDEQVVCFTVIGLEGSLEGIEQELGERYGGLVEIHFFENQYSPGWHWLTVHDKRATKDKAITVVRESFDLAGHELVVFGDQRNDIKMFQLATQAVAVSNATNAVKHHATHVIGSNEEDSVARFIQDHYESRLDGPDSRNPLR